MWNKTSMVSERPAMDQTIPRCQEEVVGFMSDPDAYRPRPDAVQRLETHGAYVFLAGDTAYKIKRAVRFSYMDFSTLARREAMCRHELALNRAHAPQIYRDVIAVTREADGTLALGGAGDAVEWVLRMRRFPQEAMLSSLAARGAVDEPLIRELAAMVAQVHARATPVRDAGWPRTLAGVAGQIAGPVTDALAGGAGERRDERFDERLRTRLAALGGLPAARTAAGFVRRCHGDLHLQNIVVLDGAPVLFDALEFDERLATVDVLYDLAFLLMDLRHNGLGDHANLLLNRYLFHAAERDHFAALAQLPLLLACRAGVRAMVAMQRAAQVGVREGVRLREAAAAYAAAAASYLEATRPRLVAVGGLSGTGKSTLAARLAPRLGGGIGAVHLRSDLERKLMAGIGETERLPAASYTARSAAEVYRTMLEKAGLALGAGQAVILDGVFLKAQERRAAEALAARHSARFDGLWLTAPTEVLMQRVGERRGDASDATADVVRRQAEQLGAGHDWQEIDAAGDPAATLGLARAAVGLEGQADDIDPGQGGSRGRLQR